MAKGYHNSVYNHIFWSFHIQLKYFYLTFIVLPRFVFSNDTILFEEKFILLGSDVFINCSVNYGTEYNITSWLFDNDPLLINQTSRFSQNTSGLIIYNVTELDEGNYSCYVDQLLADILVHVECKIYTLQKLTYDIHTKLPLESYQSST